MNRSSTGATRRDVIVGGLGLACAAASIGLTQNADVKPIGAEALEQALPQSLGAWRSIPAAGVVLPPEGSLTKRLYSNVMVRAYADGTSAVTLLLAYGAIQSGNMQMHRPELCYPAAGFAIASSQRVDIPLTADRAIAAKLLETRSSVRAEQVLYWTRVGGEFPTTRLEQRWSVLRQNFTGQVPDGMLVRTSIAASSSAAALPILENFVDALIKGVSPGTRKLLLG